MTTHIDIEELRERFRYEPDTGDFYLRYSVKKSFDTSKKVGCLHKASGYIYLWHKRQTISAHRLAWALTYGEWPKLIDHIDQNKANNRIENLRIAKPWENGINQPARNKLGVKGVRAIGQRFQAQIKFRKKDIRIGMFDTLDEAAHAYNKRAIELFGEFAVLNPVGQAKP